MKVYVHIDGISGRIGNGGFLMLVQLAQELSRMGYKVGVFDHLDRLQWHQFSWLSIPKYNFEIVPFDQVSQSNAPIVTSWISAILPTTLDPGRICYWDQSELLRDGMDEVRSFVFENCDKIAINNQHLEHLYRKVGYPGQILHLDNWVRSDLFYYEPEIKQRMVGCQSDNRVFSIQGALEQSLEPVTVDDSYIEFGAPGVLLCEGTQAQVAEKMRRCDIFVFWNRHADCFNEVGLRGEVFGLSLFEAMASGCVCIARHHDGIDFLSGTIPMTASIDRLLNAVANCRDGAGVPGRDFEGRVRSNSLALIESEYRWDDRRRSVIEELLS